MVQKRGYLGFYLVEKCRVIVLQPFNLPDPIARFAGIDDNRQILVVGAKHELCEETHLLAVLTFRLHLVAVGGGKFFQPFGVLALVEQHLIDHDDKFAVLIRVELTAEAFVCVEGHIGLKQCFEKVEECGFTRISFLRHKKEYRKFLQRHRVEQLQIVKTEVVLASENMPHKSLDCRPLSRHGDMADW